MSDRSSATRELLSPPTDDGAFRLRYLGDPVLTTPCVTLTSVEEIPAGLIDAMRDVIDGKRRGLVDHRKGLGLAANQVGASVALCLVKMGQDDFGILVNPRITKRSTETTWVQEGCLSVPGFETSKKRHHRVTVAFTTLIWERTEREFVGLAAQVVQHELDHLAGVLITDGLSRQRRRQAERALEKARPA